MPVHQADRILVPATSPLRQHLGVSSVGSQSALHLVAMPAPIDTDPKRVAAVLPPLSGRLVEFQVGLGDAVRRGQTLALISSPDLVQAQGDVVKAADAPDPASRALECSRGVMSTGASATKDLEGAESARHQARAEDHRARTRLLTLTGQSNVDLQSHLLNVTAPVSGTVTALTMGAGASLNDTTAAWLTIAGLDPLRVTALVPESKSLREAACRRGSLQVQCTGQIAHRRGTGGL